MVKCFFYTHREQKTKDDKGEEVKKKKITLATGELGHERPPEELAPSK